MSTFMDDFLVRVILLVVPVDADIPQADRVEADVKVDASTQYAGEQDESTDATITATATGYDKSGKQLWSYSREYGEMTGYRYGDPSAPYGLMRLIADLAEVNPEEAAAQ